MPRPHAGNEWLFSIGKRLSLSKNILLELNQLFSSDLQGALIGHLDCRSSVNNKKYCDLMSVDFGYFKPSEDASLCLNQNCCCLRDKPLSVEILRK